MRQLAYIMHFRGRVSATDASFLRTMASAPGCVLTTRILSDGLETNLEATAAGDLAFLDSELSLDGSVFHENGTICFGDGTEHVLHFSTIGDGHIHRMLTPGTMVGTATCNIEEGEGQFSKARGYIATTFTLTDSGDLEQYHSGLIFLPDPGANDLKEDLWHAPLEIH